MMVQIATARTPLPPKNKDCRVQSFVFLRMLSRDELGAINTPLLTITVKTVPHLYALSIERYKYFFYVFIHKILTQQKTYAKIIVYSN